MNDSIDEVSFHARSYVVQDVNIAKIRRSMIPKEAAKPKKLVSFKTHRQTHTIY